LEQLAGPVPPRLPGLFAMPLVASIVYALLAWFRPPDVLIRLFIAGPGILIPTAAGLILFIIALIHSYRSRKSVNEDQRESAFYLR
jgi:hypothetical protein